MRRADAAIHADDVGASPLHLRRELFGRRPIQAVSIVLDRHLRHDRQRRHATNCRNRRPHLVQIAKRLEDKQVDAALDQCLGLLAEVRLGFVGPHLAPWLDADTERTDGSGHVRLVACRLTGDTRAFDVDLAHTIPKAERPQLDSVRAERVGLQDVRSRPDVVLVDFRHGVGRHDVDRIEAAVDEDALCVQHRPHRAIADEHTIVEGFKKRLHGSPGGSTSPGNRLRRHPPY